MEEEKSLHEKIIITKQTKTKSVLVLICLVFLFVVLSFFSIKWFEIQSINNIKISGNSILSNTEINEIIRDEIINLPQEGIDLLQITKKLRTHPYIADASVWFNSKGVLGIEISERYPIAIVIGKTGETEFVDKYGVIIPCRLYKEFNDMPIISNVYNGHNVNKTSLAGALLIVNELQNSLSLFSNIVSEISYREKDRSYELYLTESNLRVLFGRTDNIVDKLTKLYLYWKSQLSHATLTDSIKYLDVRWSNMVVVSH